MGKTNINLEKAVEKAIIELSTSIFEDSERVNQETIDRLKQSFDENEELYDTQIVLAFYFFVEFASKPWFEKYKPKNISGKDKCIIQYMYNGLIQHFVRTVIEKKEGSVYSGDKESFIMQKLKESIIDNKNISLYMTYGESSGKDKIDKSEWNKRAYWSPKSFKDTDDVKEQFWKWYNVC